MATGFLVTSLSCTIKSVNEAVKKQALKRLYIQVHLNKMKPYLRCHYQVSKTITELYSSAAQLYPNLDIRIILNELKKQGKTEFRKAKYDVDVIILPKSYKSDEIASFVFSTKKLSIVEIEVADDQEDERFHDQHLNTYNHVVLGGTFDRLHVAHKILISQALLRCNKKVTIGVTDTEMIKSKILWELIEPCQKRMEAIKSFIEEIDNTVMYNIVPITDMYGPTKTIPDIDLIVVSSETQKGGEKINEYRRSHGMKELEISCISIVEDEFCGDEEETKISSSNIRKRLLGTRLRNPEVKQGIPVKPYIIGLTGGICSGKSTIAEYLNSLGAGLIDCDKVAHELYKTGTPVFKQLVKLFGQEIVGENGEINRKTLGGIVFSNPEKLELLNKIMWPRIMEEAMVKSRKMYVEQNKNIIILEAAVLLQAGWDMNVHEVWTSIIPEEEAINRLMARNHLTEEEAKQRIQAQPSNLEQVSIANVVFCTLWSKEYTRKQVHKAWRILNESINL